MKHTYSFFILLIGLSFTQFAAAQAVKINPTTVEVRLDDASRITFDFYGNNIFRMFQDNSGGIIRDPEASPEAQILTDSPRRAVNGLEAREQEDISVIKTNEIELRINKKDGLFSVTDLRDGDGTASERERGVSLRTGRKVLQARAPIQFDSSRVTLTFKEEPDEYFYGGGVQNGRFSHKGKIIKIENQNSWTDGGVASPCPFYWSTNGYGVMAYTFKKGEYDFGASSEGTVTVSHETPYLDIFIMVDETPVALLNDFHQLTGHPVLIPKFGFYQGHLNAYNRDYWKESDDKRSVLFEDGKRCKESQKDTSGIKESLNGEKGNYQFSARAVVDRYDEHDMPFGWILPNDGYGAGYGQTSTLDGNIENLRQFGDYARGKGVQIGLWTQSDLHPKEGVEALLQRDIVKEVRDAGVRVLKTDVAWVGAGYSFGLNGVADVGHIMPYYGGDARPFIISLDGWAGTQRYATIWTGDQTGGVWEYIRFHIPTYIGSGLSGQPNICSDMDGIFGGGNATINVRDFQWKTFTPIQLNMDGWGANPKYPHIFGEPAASINRSYLKLKAELLPYAYSVAKESVDGMPQIRAMFLSEPNEYTLGSATQYQFMFGPSFLVAPVYCETQCDEVGNDIRNGIYLPEGQWIDYFSGDLYEGGCILNGFEAPLWKIPLFVKAGSIIPRVEPNNNVSEIDPSLRIYEFYPSGVSSFTEYDDDGVSEAYLRGACATTLIESSVGSSAGSSAGSSVGEKGLLTLVVHPTVGSFEGFTKEKSTELRVNVTSRPDKLSAWAGGRKVKLSEASSLEDFENRDDCWFFSEKPDLNVFATPGSDFAQVPIVKNPVVLIRLAPVNTTSTELKVVMKGFTYSPSDPLLQHTGSLAAPQPFVSSDCVEAYTLTPSWNPDPEADFYEIEFGGLLYTAVRDTSLLFEGLEADSEYSFSVRAVNKAGHSGWGTCGARTKEDPLKYAIHGIKASCSAPDQEGFEVDRLCDFALSGDVWHSKYGAKAVPCEIMLDLRSINQIERLRYVPRSDAGNGTWKKGSVAYSLDGSDWTSAGAFDWKADGEAKDVLFPAKPTVRFIKVSLTEAVGNYGSGREIYVFKVPGTEGWLPGDINQDGRVDENDLTSYRNYTGLRKGDSDFEGYISKGDLNGNGLIDAFDIASAAAWVDDGPAVQEVSSESLGAPSESRAASTSATKASPESRAASTSATKASPESRAASTSATKASPESPSGFPETASGSISLRADKKSYKAGETVSIVVTGRNLKDITAFSFALGYDPQTYSYEGVETIQAAVQASGKSSDLLLNSVAASGKSSDLLLNSVAASGKSSAKSSGTNHNTVQKSGTNKTERTKLNKLTEMEDFTLDRLHTNGAKSLYPTFVLRQCPPPSEDDAASEQASQESDGNEGNSTYAQGLTGNPDLIIIKLKALKPATFDLNATDVVLVSSNSSLK